MIEMVVKLLTFMLPWFLRRKLLCSIYGFKIHPSAYIGLSWIFPKVLVMEEGAKIDHFTIAIHLDKIQMGINSSIGRSNWITGFPTEGNSLHFRHQNNRRPELHIGESSNITKSHHIDCTNLIKIGRFSTIAGYNSQFLTHSINITDNRQDSNSIYIGDFTFIGTNVVVLGGSVLPSYSVLAAKSLLNKAFTEDWKLYGGVPANSIKSISKEAKYFTRKDGFVY
jgi:acetyltransferase-like isoleucine patch superfamily enzyme